jgi:hypothetical protein
MIHEETTGGIKLSEPADQMRQNEILTEQLWKQAKEAQEYHTARILAVTVIVSIVILTLACLAALTIVVSTFLFSIRL